MAKKFFLKNKSKNLFRKWRRRQSHTTKEETRSTFMPAEREHPLSPASVATRWLATVSPAAAREYQRDLDRLLDWISRRGGDPRGLFALGLADAHDYAAHLRSRYAPATSARALDALSSLWEHARREARAVGLDLQNIWRARETPRPRVPSRLPWRTLTEEQIRRVLAACGSHLDYAVILGMYHTGLRVSELAAARWSDLRDTPEGPVLAVVGKGSKTRVVGVSLACLSAWRRVSRRGNPYILPGRGDGPMSRIQIWRVVKRVGRDAGISNLSPHWLRHAHASHALHHGVDLATLMASLGHADMRTTAKYLHANPSRLSTDFIPGAERQSRSN